VDLSGSSSPSAILFQNLEEARLADEGFPFPVRMGVFVGGLVPARGPNEVVVSGILNLDWTRRGREGHGFPSVSSVAVGMSGVWNLEGKK
jgi:hypothetical protein